MTKNFGVNIVESSQSPTEDNENRYVYELQQERKVRGDARLSLLTLRRKIVLFIAYVIEHASQIPYRFRRLFVVEADR